MRFFNGELMSSGQNGGTVSVNFVVGGQNGGLIKTLIFSLHSENSLTTLSNSFLGLTVTERVSVCTDWTGVLSAMDDEQLAILLLNITVVTRVVK